MQNCLKQMFGVTALLMCGRLCLASQDNIVTLAPLPIPEGVHVVTPAAQIRVPVRSWKTLRDARVTKQNLDYSCGAASLATLLNEFYGQSVTEQELLDAMQNDKLRASFEDMQKALPQFGFRAQGYAASFEQLTKLKAPVVVYLKHRKDDHFSVLRGINQNTVWLADPSLGNRTYSKEQFLEMWNTRGDKENTDLSGKFLAVFPNQAGISPSADFFTKIPLRQTARALEQIPFRPWF
jgi:predicted double-glycine peptidase